MKQRRCTATTKSGNPCRSFALAGGPYCIAHDPDKREEQLQASRAGGLAKANAARSAKEWAQLSRHITIADLPGVLVGAGLAAMNGEVEPARVTALATAIRTAVHVAEVGVLEARLKELESLFGIGKQ